MIKIVTIFVSAFFALAITAANAAEIEEVVVTATKRDSNIRDVPFSINAQT